MKDLTFEVKRSLSRLEAADQLTALAAALREGGEAELEIGAGTLSLRIPDELRCELEVEIGDGQIELEIEFKWPLSASGRTAASSQAATAAEKQPGRKSAPAESGRRSSAKRSPKKTP
ncbi:amphi-Trp domain-containing protein [Streptomyces sp. NBC_01565]|uniref:amphi-Trp domain-containing protein n=1 Tax=unclassified Streptomyces TaxID=2593676 RepID=UPI00225AD6D4|nr:amphi-Trp domain-containing protein [Streptomyces sp. NBC_01565]MCX4547016.1 amphi-Trp domain-containing protein [Streptomyces sp. NBC_01565]